MYSSQADRRANQKLLKGKGANWAMTFKRLLAFSVVIGTILIASIHMAVVVAAFL